ncbi:M6 family metalloprotease domain-containing protein [uncultured Candidatus Kuenenia sp.]|uniref:M6 family metalloprotease domain-containing protein n=1 Tax=uncultured Candidatus Kuenenia sp. TaxID=1048336 RepID=UPI0025F83657|nr:M6 family metalloprotease domain-containing protein [uncultured Candidatus Kuenenia sp.]
MEKDKLAMPAPFCGKEFTFTQPNGTKFQVKGWGNQYYAVFESLDGFTIMKDPATGYYHYAQVSADGKTLQPTKIRVGTGDPRFIGIQPGVRIDPSAAKARATENKLHRGLLQWEIRRKQARIARIKEMVAPGLLYVPSVHHIVGNYVGLCLLIEFPDIPRMFAQKQVNEFCNEIGYTGFGNNGSVYDYFFEVSSGKLHYNNIVVPYYRTRNKGSYYKDPKVVYGLRAQELVLEALADLEAKGFDFSQLTTDNDGAVRALNVFYAGPNDSVVDNNNKPTGLWPHCDKLLNPYVLRSGKKFVEYQITNMGKELTLGTFCHENGHMICDFPDLYDKGEQSYGVGVFCLMSYGCCINEKNPVHVCAYLKYQAGWANTVTDLVNGMSANAVAGQNSFFIHRRNEDEYFILENRDQTGRDMSLPDAGLAIWHVDERVETSNENEHMTPDSHYECSLEQADGMNDLEKEIKNGNYGDGRDLFPHQGNNRFADISFPNSKWWDGTSSNLDIYQIGATGQQITFSVKL